MCVCVCLFYTSLHRRQELLIYVCVVCVKLAQLFPLSLSLARSLTHLLSLSLALALSLYIVLQ
jgi:hypothetical protein